MSLPHLYILTSFMLSVSALFAITISSLILHGHQEVLHTAQQIKDALAVESVDSAVTDSFHDYYSVFNSRGGWLNLAHLLLGVGLVTEKVSTLLAMAAITFLSGMLPYKLLGQLRHNRDSGSRARWQTIVSFSSCFSGGVFIAACLLDLLPDIEEKIEEVSTLKH